MLHPLTLTGLNLGALLYYGLLRRLLDEKMLSSMMNFSLKHLYKVLSLVEKLLLFDLRGCDVDILDSGIISYCGATLSTFGHFSCEIVTSSFAQQWEIERIFLSNLCHEEFGFRSLKNQIYRPFLEKMLVICALSFLKYVQRHFFTPKNVLTILNVSVGRACSCWYL